MEAIALSPTSRLDGTDEKAFKKDVTGAFQALRSTQLEREACQHATRSVALTRRHDTAGLIDEINLAAGQLCLNCHY